MKGGQNLRDLQDKKKAQQEEAWIHQPICCVCQKACEGYYGRYGNTGVCSGKCMREHQLKPMFPGHEATTFEELHHATLSGEHDGEVES